VCGDVYLNAPVQVSHDGAWCRNGDDIRRVFRTERAGRKAARRRVGDALGVVIVVRGGASAIGRGHLTLRGVRGWPGL
jgi:hypothetical protein